MGGESPAEQVGPYLVYELLGAGGMATVHRAEREGIEGFRRPVALKRLLPHLIEDQDIVDAFVREAQLAAKLHHANIAQTFDLGRVDDTYFIAMEYVPGPTLTQVMRHCEDVGAMPMPIVLAILIQICDALDHAHNLADEHGRALGIVHRDVSPANIIISNTGMVKLIDFGIAKVMTGEHRTQAGLIKGKFAYLAPEYIGGTLDHRADLFALGIVGWELLTGKPLFHTSNDFDTIQRVREMPIQPPSRWHSHVTRDLDDIILTALQRDPALRWQSAGAMRMALANCMREIDVIVGPKEVFDWVEWAFSQRARPEDSALINVIETLGQPTVAEVQLSADELEELEAIEQVTIATPATNPRVPAPDPPPPVESPNARTFRGPGVKASRLSQAMAAQRGTEGVAADVTAAISAQRLSSGKIPVQRQSAGAIEAQRPVMRLDSPSGIVVVPPRDDADAPRGGRMWLWIAFSAAFVVAVVAALVVANRVYGVTIHDLRRW